MSTMVQLVPALVLAIAAFLTTAFALIYSVYPLLPPHRVWKQGINIISNTIPSPSNGAHIWLALVEAVSVTVFVWQAVMDEVGFNSSVNADSMSAASAARTWFMLTARHTCMLLLTSLACYSSRRGSFAGWHRVHAFIWAPLLLISLVGTVLAAVGARSHSSSSLPIGLVAFAFTTSIISTVLLCQSHRNIQHHLAKVTTPAPRYPDRKWSSYSTADVAALKEGSSWITSYTSSQRPSIAGFSFSTARTVTTNLAQSPEIAKQPLPSAPPSHGSRSAETSGKSHEKLSGGTSSTAYYTADEYGKIQSGQGTPKSMSRAVSQSSWLTEPSALPPTMSSWSFPTSRGTNAHSNVQIPPPSAWQRGSLRSNHSMVLRAIPAQSMDTLHINGNLPSTDSSQLEAGLLHERPSSPLHRPLAPKSSPFKLDRLLWPVYIFSSPVFALPYMVTSLADKGSPNKAASILLILAMTLPSFILALCIACGQFPFPADLESQIADEEFASPISPPVVLPTLPARSSADLRSSSRLHKRSGSATVSVFQVQRADDVWLLNGDAIEGNKLKRAISFLSPKPKLSILPSCSTLCVNEKDGMKSKKSLSPRNEEFTDQGALYISQRQYAEYVQRASELEIHMAVSDQGHAQGNFGSVRSMRSLDSSGHASTHRGRDYGSYGRSHSRLAGSITEEDDLYVNPKNVEQRRREALALIEARASSNVQKDNSIQTSRQLSHSKSNLLKRISPPSPFPGMSNWRASPSFSPPEQASMKRTYKAHKKDGTPQRRKRSSPRLVRPNKRVSFALEARPSPRAQRSVRSRESASRRVSVSSSRSRQSNPAPSRIPIASSRVRQSSTASGHSCAPPAPVPTSIPSLPETSHTTRSYIPRRAPSSLPTLQPQIVRSGTSTIVQPRECSDSSGGSMSSFERGVPLAWSTPPSTFGLSGRDGTPTHL